MININNDVNRTKFIINTLKTNFCALYYVRLGQGYADSCLALYCTKAENYVHVLKKGENKVTFCNNNEFSLCFGNSGYRKYWHSRNDSYYTLSTVCIMYTKTQNNIIHKAVAVILILVLFKLFRPLVECYVREYLSVSSCLALSDYITT